MPSSTKSPVTRTVRLDLEASLERVHGKVAEFIESEDVLLIEGRTDRISVPGDSRSKFRLLGLATADDLPFKASWMLQAIPTGTAVSAKVESEEGYYLFGLISSAVQAYEGQFDEFCSRASACGVWSA